MTQRVLHFAPPNAVEHETRANEFLVLLTFQSFVCCANFSRSIRHDLQREEALACNCPDARSARPQAVGLVFLKFHDGHEFHESSRMKTSADDSCEFMRFVAKLLILVVVGFLESNFSH